MANNDNVNNNVENEVRIDMDLMGVLQKSCDLQTQIADDVRKVYHHLEPEAPSGDLEWTEEQKGDQVKQVGKLLLGVVSHTVAVAGLVISIGKGVELDKPLKKITKTWLNGAAAGWLAVGVCLAIFIYWNRLPRDLRNYYSSRWNRIWMALCIKSMVCTVGVLALAAFCPDGKLRTGMVILAFILYFVFQAVMFFCIP